MKKTFVVAWMFNGNSFSKEYSEYYLAVAEMIRLEAFGVEPTVHEKERD